jgi:hypothetical protein
MGLTQSRQVAKSLEAREQPGARETCEKHERERKMQFEKYRRSESLRGRRPVRTPGRCSGRDWPINWRCNGSIM